MALAFASRCVKTHLRRDTGNWTGKVMFGGSLRPDWFPENDQGSVAAGIRQGPGGHSETNRRQEPLLPMALRPSAQSGAMTGHLELWQPLFTPRDRPNWGTTEEGGRLVQRLSQALTVLQLYRTQRTSGKQSPLVVDLCSGAWALVYSNVCIMHAKGVARQGSNLSCRALFSQRMNDKYHDGLWSFQTFKQIIVTNAYATPEDGNRYWYSDIKVQHQCRTYGYFKDDRRYSNRNNAFPLPRRSNTVYYDILKISCNATQSQIKSAYYKQSLIYHPDRNAGSEEAALKFTQINEAYSVLGSESLRKKYDRGILTPADLYTGKKPLEKSQTSKAKQSQAWSSSGKSDTGKSTFNFDEFYRAHYGEQLAKEQALRWRRMQLRKNRENLEKKWQLHKLIEVAVTVMLMTGFFLLFSSKNK